MNDSYDSRQASILQKARAFVKAEIAPYVCSFETQQAIPKALIKKMAKHGFLTPTMPLELGGLALDPVYYGSFLEIFGKVCMGSRSLLTVHNSLVSEVLLRFGTETQKTQWLGKLISGEMIGAFALSEPDVGSDSKNLHTTWRKDGNAYVIDGVKKWITLGGLADLFIVIAQNNGHQTAFLIEVKYKGIKVKKIQGLMAAKTTFLSEIHFNKVVVTDENILGKLNSAHHYVVSMALDHGRYDIAWAGVAIAQAALEAMVLYSRKRSQFSKKLREFQLIRGIIADAVTKVHAARAICIRAGELRRMKDDRAIIETTIAKYFSSKVAVEVANDAVQVHGGNGFIDQYPVERLYREAKVLEIIEGTSQIQQEIIANYGLSAYWKA